jgi:outer membrane protein OmpA-like peptidoglycan-associated protein
MSYKKIHTALVFAGVLLCISAAFAADSKLRLRVDPKQAYIFVDDVPFGEGSRIIKIASGNHKIGVYNYGFASQVREVNVEPKTITELEFKLDPVAGDVKGPWGRIQIESASTAAVLLTGKTPDYFVGHGDEFNHGGAFLPCCKQQLIVPPGTYPVTIVNKDKVLWSGTINVNANERVIINAANGTQRVRPWPDGGKNSPLPRFTAETASATVAVAPVTGSLTASKTQINCGDSTNLNWATTETVERTVSSGAEAVKQSDPSGEASYRPTQTTTYTLEASGPGGTVSSKETVNVNTSVQSSLHASSGEIRYRRIGDKVIEQGSTDLAWTSSNAQTVSIDPLGTVGANDTRSLKAEPKQQGDGSLNEVQTYVLTAKNECGGSDTQTATVRIVGSIEPVPVVQMGSVFFPTGYPDEQHPDRGLLKSQQDVLAQTAAGFKSYLEYDSEARLSVLGNTDERDSKDRNKSLSQRRADLVKQYLVSLGVPEAKIETVAQGKEVPLDSASVKLLQSENPNQPPNSLGGFRDLVWAYNRRADLVLLPKGDRSKQYFPATAGEADLLFSSEWPNRKDDMLILAGEKESLPVESVTPQQNHK